MIKNLIIFTDLDGTLLDKKTYQPGPALKSLNKCRKLNIPVVFVSGKSRAEIEPIRKELNNDLPFICENGGGLYIPIENFPDLKGFAKNGKYWCWRSDQTIDTLRKILYESSAKTGVEVKSFYQMTASEVARLTGLSKKQSELAKLREFDEPFILIDPTMDKLDALKKVIIKRGCRYTSGGYLHHITGAFDKGQTLSLLKNAYYDKHPQTQFAGIGDAYNDLPMLRLVDYPFLVRQPDGGYESGIVFEGLTITRGIGPLGFVEAIEHLIKQFIL